MWRLYSIGFGVMAAAMIALGVVLFIATLLNPMDGAGTPEWVWLVRAVAAVVLGGIAATLSLAARRQARRPQA
ncbi:MAG: hypothetical protein KGO05_13740 [Chloroflexota bacterium]|nr:hypothetical protein [Chloroflexota bacterium]